MPIERCSILYPLVCLSLAMLAFATVHAQPGTLDPDFAGDGTVTHEIKERNQARDVFLEPDGAVVTFGHAENHGDPSSRAGTLTRFNVDGSLDASHTFPGGAFGCVPTQRVIFAGTRLANGQYLTSGNLATQCSGGERPFDVRRIRETGAVDDTFEHAFFHGEESMAASLVVQADDKVVTAGFTTTTAFDPATRNVAFARHHADGTLDTGFDGNGEVTFDIDGDRDQINAVALQDSGRIIGAGLAVTGNGEDFLLVGLNVDGSIDTGFQGSGIVTHDFEGYDDRLFDLVIDDYNRILVAGRSTSDDSVTRQATVMRFGPDGVVDTGFGDSGIAVIDTGAVRARADAVATGPTGRIYVAGATETGTGGENSQDAMVAVLQPDGSLDSTFGTDGITTFEFGVGPIDRVAAVAVDEAAGRIAVAGFSGERVDGDLWVEIAAARLTGFADALFADRFEDSM